MSTNYYIVNRETRNKQLRECNVVNDFITNVIKKATDLYTCKQISENTLDDITGSCHTWEYFVDIELGDYNFLSTTNSRYYFMSYTGWYNEKYNDIHTIYEAVQFVKNNENDYYIMDEYGEYYDPQDILKLIRNKLGN